MRVSFVLPPVDLSGGIRVIAIYAERLQQRGHRVTLVSTPHRRPSLKARLKMLAKGRWWRAPSLASHIDGRNLDHRVIDIARPIVDQDVGNADVVIATWWETAEWVAALNPDKGVKVHFVQGHEIFPWLPFDRTRAVYRLPLKKIVVAKWLRDVMLEEYGCQSEVVPNAVDHAQFFAPRRSKSEIPTLGYIYSDTPLKGAPIARAVISKIRETIPALRVVSFGSSRAKDLAPGTDFHFRPQQGLIRDLYASCDVWLCTSVSEGFGLPAMEAMACRTPVVSTRTGWAAEAIDGANGFLADIDDVDGLAAGALAILKSSNWSAFSDAAFQTAQPFNWDASAAMFEAALIRSLQEKKG